MAQTERCVARERQRAESTVIGGGVGKQKQIHVDADRHTSLFMVAADSMTRLKVA